MHSKSKAHISNKDDPIFGSLGPPEMAFDVKNNTKLNMELEFENEMRKKVPRTYTESNGFKDT